MTTGLAPSKQSFILTASYVNIKSNNNHLTRPRRGSDFNIAPFKMNKVFISIEDIPFYIERIPYMYNNNRRLVIFKAMSNLHELNKLSPFNRFYELDKEISLLSEDGGSFSFFFLSVILKNKRKSKGYRTSSAK